MGIVRNPGRVIGSGGYSRHAAETFYVTGVPTQLHVLHMVKEPILSLIYCAGMYNDFLLESALRNLSVRFEKIINSVTVVL